MPRIDAKDSRKSSVQVALLRGINVGGKHKLPMKRLVTMFEDAGCTNVRSFIQSGNVLYEAGSALARRIPVTIGEAIAEEFGFEVPVITRSADELRRAIRANPFLEKGGDESALHVAFLADRPAKAKVSGLDPDRSPPDDFAVRGREVYLRCPNGVGRTKLTNAYFESKLGTRSTMRNWRTALKVRELAVP